MFAAAMAGERDSRIKDLNSLMQVCQSLHLVCQPVEGMTVPECEGNKEKYDCVGCKSFKAVGICSHVLAVNHVSKKFNVRYVLGRLQTGASKTAAMKGGNTLRPPPALQRAPVADPDSCQTPAMRRRPGSLSLGSRASRKACQVQEYARWLRILRDF